MNLSAGAEVALGAAVRSWSSSAHARYGYFFRLVTVTLAVPLTPALDAVTVNGPPAVLALNRPELLIVPPPFTDQANDGCVLNGWPN